MTRQGLACYRLQSHWKQRKGELLLIWAARGGTHEEVVLQAVLITVISVWQSLHVCQHVNKSTSLCHQDFSVDILQQERSP